MVAKIEKTVFISYRRENEWIALAVYDRLTKLGFDVFLDFKSIKNVAHKIKNFNQL